MDSSRVNPAMAPVPKRNAPVLVKSILCSLAIVAVLAGILLPGAGHQGESFSPADQQARTTAFQASLPIVLTQVPNTDLHTAIVGMHLPKTSHISVLTSATPAALLNPQMPPRLAWITLWDSDVEDGDAVRLDSAGYSRTVSLTKQPQTFAIPVTATGQVTLTGVRDGDGGGITVGVASGAQQVLVPIMSVNQVLPLTVRIN